MAQNNFAVNALSLVAFVATCLGLLAFRGTFFSDSLGVAASTAKPAAHSALTIYYHERPPYYFTDGNQVKGVVVDRVAAALRIAGIEFRWELMPPTRQLQAIRDAESPCAAIGWFANPERRGFAQFSDPVFQDNPLVALTEESDGAIGSQISLDELFQRESLRFLLKDSYSYGNELDVRIASLGTRRVFTPAGNAAMLEMIAADRADVMFLAPEEALAMLSNNAARSATFRIVPVRNMPPGSPRHLMFSRAVPEGMVQRFDYALRQLPADLNGGSQ